MVTSVLIAALAVSSAAPVSAATAFTAGEPTASAAVTTQTVSEKPITGVSFPTSVSLKAGESKTLTVTTFPSNTTYLTNIEWGYQTNGHFSYKTNGYGTYWNKPSSAVITGTSAGKGYLTTTVKVYDSSKNYVTQYKVSTTVTVTDSTATTQPATQPKTQPATQPKTQPATKPTTQPTNTIVALKSISLNRTSVSLKTGGATTLSVSYNPSNTTVSRTLKWSSSNTTVARVAAGKVTAVKAGTATITASCNGKTATCKVTVQSAEKYRNVSEAYTLLNTFRTTKSNQWYWKSNNKSKQTVYGLKKLKKDGTLEKIAKQRAKEQWIMYYDKGKATHTRPNGKAWSTAYPSSMKYKGENLGWGYTSCKAVVIGKSGWAETDKKYSGQGHRRNMLDKNYTRVGIACYEKDGQTCWAMCLAK